MEGPQGWGLPIYRHVLDRVGLDAGAAVLDVGCGAGRFARLAADRGATVSGLDATAGFIEIAAERTPEGDFRVGEMEELPWEDDRFDLVTGFNSFFIAASMVNAMAEARRVAKPGAFVATSVFGRPEHCDTTQMFAAVKGLLPPDPDGGKKNGGPALHDEGVLEDVASRAGLEVHEADYLAFDEVFPDLETLLRGVMAAPPNIRASRAVGEDAVRDAIAEALAPQRQSSGEYRLREEVRYLIARA
jgi:SAM-dependent methyltransferase